MIVILSSLKDQRSDSQLINLHGSRLNKKTLFFSFIKRYKFPFYDLDLSLAQGSILFSLFLLFCLLIQNGNSFPMLVHLYAGKQIFPEFLDLLLPWTSASRWLTAQAASAHDLYLIELRPDSGLPFGKTATRQWWHIPLIPALGRKRQVDLCEFAASLVYKMNSRTAR